MKKTIIIILLAGLLLTSGCLQRTEVFDDKGSEILNQQHCNEICDKLTDVANVKEVKCDDESNCLCVCDTRLW